MSIVVTGNSDNLLKVLVKVYCFENYLIKGTNILTCMVPT